MTTTDMARPGSSTGTSPGRASLLATFYGPRDGVLPALHARLAAAVERDTRDAASGSWQNLAGWAHPFPPYEPPAIVAHDTSVVRLALNHPRATQAATFDAWHAMRRWLEHRLDDACVGWLARPHAIYGRSCRALVGVV